jgi:3D (Asp-Asp-Asp) domain-containing protein
MNHRKFISLILVAIILTLILTLLIRENQHQSVMADYYNNEILKEEARIDNLNDFTAGYNELYKSYNELYVRYEELHRNLTSNKWIEYEVTGYSANDSEQGTNNIVATNFNLDYENVKNIPIIATDPKVIPLYSIVEIEGMGAYLALDTGGMIKGFRIDILFDSKQQALDFGRQTLLARVIK